mmetsp:Transcript_17475/g.25677  ORF Transcript_17475/g.25677 Transcript_17475/m.25677 type:complete len:90 (-) Transcript_17475:329-598(-)
MAAIVERPSSRVAEVAQVITRALVAPVATHVVTDEMLAMAAREANASDSTGARTPQAEQRAASAASAQVPPLQYFSNWDPYRWVTPASC